MKAIIEVAETWYSQINPEFSVYDWCDEWKKEFSKEVYQKVLDGADYKEMLRDMGFYWHTEEEQQDPVEIMYCFIFGDGTLQGLIERVRLEYQGCA